MTTTSTMGRNFPTLRYVGAPFRWFFRSRRRVLTAAAVLLAMLVAPPLWWSIQLMGLPDVGEPFDVAAFRAIRIPDDRNAFVLYRQAAAVLKPLKSSGTPAGLSGRQLGPWPKDEAEARRWVEENREAMALYRRGTERPDALVLGPPAGAGSWEVVRTLISFHVLAQLEAGRLEQQGDRAGAWGWYRAAFRATHHMGLRGTLAMRGMAHRCHTELEARVAMWAADPRTSPALLRQALDDAVGFGAFVPSETYTLQAEYPELERLLGSRQNPGRYVPLMRLAPLLMRSPYFPQSRELLEAIADGWRFWRREPERSRRVLRLVFANWLAHDALPPERRPAADPGLSGFLEFYALGPEAPAGARALSPAALERWVDSTSDASTILRGMGFQGIHLQERSNHRALVVLLGRALYRRDHGDDPPSDKALVGPYLKSLPDDGLGDQDKAVGGGGTMPEGAGE